MVYGGRREGVVVDRCFAVCCWGLGWGLDLFGLEVCGGR